MTARIDTVAVVVTVRDGVPAVGATDALGVAVEVVDDPTNDLTVVCVGSGADRGAVALADAGFADLPVHLAEAGPFAPGAWAAALAPHLTHADVVLLPGSADGRDLAPRLAAEVDRPLYAGVLALDAERAVLARASGRAMAEARWDLPVVATLQPGVVGAPRTDAAEPVAPVPLDGFSVGPTDRDVTLLEVAEADAATMDLAESPFILGAGIGLGTEESVTALGDVAAALDASVGATRVVTDEGWLPHERQIGTTGVVVHPRVYVAFGISGAVQHTAGLGDPDHVITVNTDPHCPMMQLSDLAIVADAPSVVDELRRRLAPDTGEAP